MPREHPNLNTDYIHNTEDLETTYLILCIVFLLKIEATQPGYTALSHGTE